MWDFSYKHCPVQGLCKHHSSWYTSILKDTVHLLLVWSFRAPKWRHLPAPSASSQTTVTAQDEWGTSISFYRQILVPHLPLLTIGTRWNKMVRSLCPTKKQLLYIGAATADDRKAPPAAHLKTYGLFSPCCQLTIRVHCLTNNRITPVDISWLLTRVHTVLSCEYRGSDAARKQQEQGCSPREGDPAAESSPSTASTLSIQDPSMVGRARGW